MGVQVVVVGRSGCCCWALVGGGRWKMESSEAVEVEFECDLFDQAPFCPLVGVD